MLTPLATVTRGIPISLVVTWTDDAGQPVDLTGYTVRAQLKAGIHGDAWVSFSTADGTVSIPAPVTGELELLGDDDASRLIPQGSLWAWLVVEATRGDGVPSEPLRGLVRVRDEAIV